MLLMSPQADIWHALHQLTSNTAIAYILFFLFFFSWVDFVRNCCGKTTIKIKLAVHNSRNLTLICNFCFRRGEVGDPLLQNTAAASALVGGFAEQNSSSGLPSTWHRTTRVWWHCIYQGEEIQSCFCARLAHCKIRGDFPVGIGELTACGNVTLAFAHSGIVLL